MKKVTGIVFINILMVLTLFSQEKEWRKGILIDEFIYEEAPFPSCHAATIAETPGGLVAAFFGGTHERNPDVCIYVSRRVNKKWTAPLMVANGVVNDTFRLPTWNPVLYQIPNGDLILFYKIGPKPSNWQGWMKTSPDGGKTWSEGKMMPKGYIGPVKNKPVLLSDGILLCPSSTEGDGWKVYFEKTTDFGKTWTKYAPINDGNKFPSIQPTILTHSNGKLQMLCRTKKCAIGQAWSSDNGKSWSDISATVLPNNNSGIDAVTLSDGRHLLVYNHVKPPEGKYKGKRTPLHVSVSDDGEKWFAALILEDSEISQYSYPSVIQSSDGYVHIVYTWRRERVKYVKIDLEQLVLREIVDEKWPE